MQQICFCSFKIQWTVGWTSSQLSKTRESDLKFEKKLTSAEKTYIYVIHVKSRFWREIWNRALLSQFDSLFTPEPKWFQSETFLLASLVSLTLNLCTLLDFREKTGNFAVQVCCQNYASAYSKFNTQSDELSPSFPK